jgi:hypothetical protein
VAGRSLIVLCATSGSPASVAAGGFLQRGRLWGILAATWLCAAATHRFGYANGNGCMALGAVR